MPFASRAQQRYMYAHEKELAKEGVDLKEYSAATDFKTLPERKKKFSHATGTGKAIQARG